MQQFWIYLGGVMKGPFEVPELCEQSGFSLMALVCEQGEGVWQPAQDFLAIRIQCAKNEAASVQAGVAVPANGITAAPDSQHPPLARVNWRSAVIGPECPDRKVLGGYEKLLDPLRFPSGVASQKRTRRVRPEGALSGWTGKVIQYRKNLLLGIVGALAVGLYFPEMDNIQAIYHGLQSSFHSSTELFGTRIKKGGVLHGGRPWKYGPFKFQRLAASAAGMARAASAAPAPKPAPRPVIQEIGSDDLGDGTAMKTVVITREVDGVKISETKNIVVPIHHSRRRKR